MVKLQPFNFTLTREGGRLKLTLHNRPSYGRDWVMRILEGACPDVVVEPASETRRNAFLLGFECTTAPELQVKEAMVRETLSGWKDTDPKFESPDPKFGLPDPSRHRALSA